MKLRKIKIEVLNVGILGEFESYEEALILFDSLLRNSEVKHYLMTQGVPKPEVDSDDDVEPLTMGLGVEMPEAQKRITYFG